MKAESIKAKLKNYSVNAGCTFHEALVYYGIERTIYRISVSRYADHFILKGGIFLYAIFDREYARATSDVDLLAIRISNSAEEMKRVFRDIFALEENDALSFDLDSIDVENITELNEYHGLHISVVAYLDRTRIPIGIDIGFGDIVYPSAVKMDFPVILDMKSPLVNAYSLESAVAEKLEVIIKNGFLNSRYKDFYDIYVLSKNYSFTYKKLEKAISDTFSNRKTSITMDSIVFSEEFVNNTTHIERWNAFLRKKKALIPISLKEAIRRIETFVQPFLKGTDRQIASWNPKEGYWK